MFGNSGPLTHKPVDFLWLARRWLTREYHDPSSAATGFVLKATWHVEAWGTWWTTFRSLHENMLRKITNNYFGGPGIRTQVPMVNTPTPLPIELERTSDNIITNKYNISKSTQVPNTRAFSNEPTIRLHVLIFFPVPANITLDSGGF